MQEQTYKRSTRLKERVGLLLSSGKAYYTLATELARRSIPYSQLNPSEAIPLDVRVVVASEDFIHLARGRSVISWTEESDPVDVAKSVVNLLEGGGRFKEVVVGVDPGKEIGVAVVADGKILEARSCGGLEEVVSEVRQALSIPSEKRLLKVGSGAGECGRSVLDALARVFSSSVEIKIVPEWGTTSKELPITFYGYPRNALSAIRIALRQGRALRRSECPGC